MATVRQSLGLDLPDTAASGSVNPGGGGDSLQRPPPPAAQASPSYLDQAQAWMNKFPLHGLMANAASQPASPGPQSWTDWATKTYSPSLADMGTVFGDAFSYGLSPSVVQGAAALNRATGAPPQGDPAGELRQRIQQAYNETGPMGPPIEAAGYALSPLTWGAVGPFSKLVGKGAAAAMPEAAPAIAQRVIPRAIESGTTGAITAGSKEAGLGGDPADILKSAALGFGVGGGIGGAIGASPLGQTATPASIAASTADETAARQAALDQLRFKNLGVNIGGKVPQTEPEVEEAINWAKGIKPEQDPAGGAPVVVKKLQAALNSPEAAEEIAARDAAAKRAADAAMLQRWYASAPMKQANVPGQAAKATEQYDPSSPQFTAMQNIATAANDPRGPLPGWFGPAVRTIATGAGSLASHLTGLPGLATITQVPAEALTALIDHFNKGPAPSALVQQQIERAYPAMTGQSLREPTGNALQNLMTWMALSGAR